MVLYTIFSVNRSSIKKEDIFNTQEYLMVKNYMSKCLNLLTECVLVDP